MLTFGSLFAGIGGMDLGLERAGIECKWQVEIDEYATRVLAKHWPNVRRWDDIKTFPPDTERIRRNSTDESINGSDRKAASPSSQKGTSGWFRESQEHDGESSEGLGVWDVDLICGGFPCQDISYAGRGAGLAGERSGLFFDAIRVVRQLRPRYVLLENVAALLTRGLDRVHGELATLGYDSESHCIPAAAVGAPHIRDRVFIVAYAGGQRIDGWSGECRGQEEAGARYQPIGSGEYADDVPNPGRWDGEGSRREICRGPIPAGWEPEPDVGRVANGIPNRVDRLRGLGNAVVPQVAEWIGKSILQHDKGYQYER